MNIRTNKINNSFFFFIIIFLCIFVFFPSKSLAQNKTIYFFWTEGCPHCQEEKQFLNDIALKYPNVKILNYEVSKDKEGQRLLKEFGQKLNANTSGVPFTVIDDHYLVGFTKGVTDNQIIDYITGKSNISSESKSSAICKIDDSDCATVENKRITLPLLGSIETKNFSLPALSIIIGALDGFNPCAMWTLLFLISLLIGIGDKKRMWLLGSAFIVTSAAVYFVFMSAWLNLLLFIGFIIWVRVLIGLVAISGGSYSLKEFFKKKDSGCKVADDEKRKKVFEKLKQLTHENSLIVALIGIILLAFAVNLVELICSAGLPAVYTQILVLSDLPKWQYYFYVLLYILFFMLDDLLIFFIAMITLHMTGITTRYSRISRLVGGVLSIVIGLILIFQPHWLMFS